MDDLKPVKRAQRLPEPVQESVVEPKNPEPENQDEGLSRKTIFLVVVLAVAFISLGAGGSYLWFSAQEQKLEGRISELESGTASAVPAPEADPPDVNTTGFSQFSDQGLAFIYPESWGLAAVDGTEYFGDGKLELETSDDVGVLVFDKGQAQVLFGYYSAAHCRETGDPNKWQGWDETGQRDSPLCTPTKINLGGKEAYVFAGGSPGSFIYNIFIPTASHGFVISDSLNSANGEYSDAQVKEVETRAQGLVKETARTLVISNPSLFN